MRIKKNDYVQVISGKDAGKRGKILLVLNGKNKVVVEGINYIHRHTKKSQQNPQGAIIKKEAPLHASNVMLYCPHEQKPTRILYRYEEVSEPSTKQNPAQQNAEGTIGAVDRPKRKKVRYSKVSNRKI
jgi:large subunit ribosomal protein L24